MGIPAMKVRQFARGFREYEPPSLDCKRLRTLVPRLGAAPPVTTVATATYDLKCFIRPDSGSRRSGSSSDHQRQECQVGSTRWNPTQEQVGILEMLYRGGMRSPNAKQIDKITAQLREYGKIEGKNVFYWFQNHKARDRQKEKRESLALALAHNFITPPSPFTSTSSSLLSSPGEGAEEVSCISQKRKYWEEEEGVEVEGDRTLKLFPLHPDGIKD